MGRNDRGGGGGGSLLPLPPPPLRLRHGGPGGRPDPEPYGRIWRPAGDSVRLRARQPMATARLAGVGAAVQAVLETASGSWGCPTDLTGCWPVLRLLYMGPAFMDVQSWGENPARFLRGTRAATVTQPAALCW
jgi:hypothetical protein